MCTREKCIFKKEWLRQKKKRNDNLSKLKVEALNSPPPPPHIKARHFFKIKLIPDTYNNFDLFLLFVY